MSPEIMALILTTLGGVAAAVKARAEAKKARLEKEKAELEKEKAELEKERADKAEKTTSAIIRGVEKAKMTLNEANLGQYLQDEIQGSATEHGVEENLNKMVKNIKNTTALDRSKLIERLEE